MSLQRLLIGKPIPTRLAEKENIGPLRGIPVLGLDALASSSYGPEAALTVFLLAGTSSLRAFGPVMAVICVLTLIVQFSYRQTIAGYPDGGGSFTVARENLGIVPGMWAGAALVLDYVLNVAVAISAGVGAIVSAIPALLPHTLTLCLVILGMMTLLNLRGIRTTGAAFMAPTYLFVLCLGIAISIGVVKTVMAGGQPEPVEPPPAVPSAVGVAGTWVLLHAFANGCTAMTGIEAVSNAVPLFRKPRVPNAQRTLSSIVAILVMLVAGIAVLSRSYGIGATVPGQPGYQSVLSQLIAATTGRGFFYFVTMVSVMAVLSLSANTSFADFPRVCRLLALEQLLPGAFAHQGRRLVYSHGIVALSLVSGALLIVFNGITDRLIPLFAIGALGAFTFSQLGMVVHWRRREKQLSRSQIINGLGATATAATLVVVAVAKFTQGAWLSLVTMGAIVLLFRNTRRYYQRVDQEVVEAGPFIPEPPRPPLIVVPLRRLDRVGRRALSLALSLSPEVHAVQVQTQKGEPEDLSSRWQKDVVEPVRARGLSVPHLVTINSEYRELVDPLINYIRKIAAENGERSIAVLIPELVERRWPNYLFQSHTASFIKWRLLHGGGPHVVLIDSPWYPRS
ncbi:MAG: APC family permease [Myxococcaceae bacterium]